MSTKGDDQKKQSHKEDGSGRISFTDFFHGLESLFDTIVKLEEEGKRETRYEGEGSNPAGRFKTAFGFSVKTNLLNNLSVKSVEPANTVTQGPIIEAEREPFVDLFNEQDHVLLVIELPGVEERDIHTEVNGDIFILSTTYGDRTYSKEVILPGDADPDTMQKKYTNGILEIKMSKK
ncbi:hypothetical protein KDW_06300 [Dictyobacter vulcani]|uniref:SHSP domain-containing protein n=1 Tax=Dictyobacter vulcani TaxID=2607529 RepID=A0A5J4KCI6_9CHLR|nr:Hsp20/alpha crystallin family protein [Dictyobacter vulcani]GER86468.1 hypothetical protein KDW_06300 [Dictyobacter vulcani]